MVGVRVAPVGGAVSSARRPRSSFCDSAPNNDDFKNAGAARGPAETRGAGGHDGREGVALASRVDGREARRRRRRLVAMWRTARVPSRVSFARCRKLSSEARTTRVPERARPDATRARGTPPCAASRVARSRCPSPRRHRRRGKPPPRRSARRTTPSASAPSATSRARARRRRRRRRPRTPRGRLRLAPTALLPHTPYTDAGPTPRARAHVRPRSPTGRARQIQPRPSSRRERDLDENSARRRDVHRRTRRHRRVTRSPSRGGSRGLRDDVANRGAPANAQKTECPDRSPCSRKQSLTAAARALDWSFVPKSVATAAERVRVAQSHPRGCSRDGRRFGRRDVSVLRHLPRRAALEGALAEGDGRAAAPPLLAADGRAFDVGVVRGRRDRRAGPRVRRFDDVLLAFCRAYGRRPRRSARRRRRRRESSTTPTARCGICPRSRRRAARVGSWTRRGSRIVARATSSPRSARIRTIRTRPPNPSKRGTFSATEASPSDAKGDGRRGWRRRRPRLLRTL